MMQRSKHSSRNSFDYLGCCQAADQTNIPTEMTLVTLVTAYHGYRLHLDETHQGLRVQSLQTGNFEVRDWIDRWAPPVQYGHEGHYHHSRRVSFGWA